MGLPVTVYRYTDAGAPQLVNNTPSEWINVLKKVLVEGYGDKQPLGWTLEFENETSFKVVFRNKVSDGGSGGYVQFYSVSGSNSSNGAIGIKCAISMTGIDAYTKPIGARALINSSSFKGWEIIGTSRGFHILLHDTTKTTMSIGFETSGKQAYFIGDIESFTPNDAAPFTLVSGVNNASDVVNTTSEGITNSQNIYCYMYATDGSNNAQSYYCFKQLYKTTSSNDGNADILNIAIAMSPVTILATSSVSAGNGTPELPFARGNVPGLYLSSFAGYKSESWPIDIIKNGVKWILLRTNLPCQHWISTGEWYV